MNKTDGIFLTATGSNGQVEFDGKRVVIKRKGILALLTQGIKGNKEISLSSLSAIQYKAAGYLFNGYIQFSFQGGQETKGGIFDAIHDENTVMFREGKQARQFEALHDAIKSALQSQTLAIDNNFSIADELKKLAEMRDSGFLTKAEFDRQKEKLLAR